jgi:enoyl-CoA hydratase
LLLRPRPAFDEGFLKTTHRGETTRVTDESDIASRVDGGVGFVTLNRPKAINSLNQGMIDGLRAVLTAWEQDDAISAVVLSGAGERGR